jgi:hypothetical protein
MSTTTIFHEYERLLDARLAQDEITPATRDNYLNDASRVVEILLMCIPTAAIQGYMEAAGYQGDYRLIIETLRELAREPRHTAFDEVVWERRELVKRRQQEDDQKTLPGI